MWAVAGPIMVLRNKVGNTIVKDSSQVVAPNNHG